MKRVQAFVSVIAALLVFGFGVRACDTGISTEVAQVGSTAAQAVAIGEARATSLEPIDCAAVCPAYEVPVYVPPQRDNVAKRLSSRTRNATFEVGDPTGRTRS